MQEFYAKKKVMTTGNKRSEYMLLRNKHIDVLYEVAFATANGYYLPSTDFRSTWNNVSLPDSRPMISTSEVSLLTNRP